MRFFVLSWLFVAVLVGYSGVLRSAKLPIAALSVAITLGFLATIAVSRYYRLRALSAGMRALLAACLASIAATFAITMRATPVDYAGLPHSLLPTFFLPLTAVTVVLIVLRLVRAFRSRKKP